MPAFIGRIEVPWTSDASGNATVTTPSLNGMILCVEFAPGAGGSQPTNNYSATLTNRNGVDLLLGGAAANLSNAAPTRVIPAASTTDASTKSGQPVAEACTLNISGAGNTKSGTGIIYVR
jgi:hypothetical protein